MLNQPRDCLLALTFVSTQFDRLHHFKQNCLRVRQTRDIRRNLLGFFFFLGSIDLFINTYIWYW